MTNVELNRMMVENFGELQYEYHNEVSWQEGDGTGSHVVYGDVLYPYLIKCLELGDVKATKKVLSFLEDILLLQDTYASEVVVLSILEPLSVSESGKIMLIQHSGCCVQTALETIAER